MNSVLTQRTPVIEDRMIGVGTQDQIVTLPALREIFSRVINNMVRAERSRRVQFPSAAHGGDFGPERFGNLDCKRTHATGRAIHENLVAWLDASLITKTLKDSDGRHWQGCCVLKRTAGWLQRQFIFHGTHILGKGSTANAEYLVAWLELGYVPADGFHLAGNIDAKSRDL